MTSISGNGTLGELHLYYRVSALINGNIGDVCYNGVTDQVADMLCKEELDIEGNCMCSCIIVTLKREHQLCYNLIYVHYSLSLPQGLFQ